MRSFESRAGVLLAGVLALSLLSGCPRRPVGFGPAPFDEAGEVLAAMRQARAAPTRLDGEARLRLRTPEQSGSADHLIALNAPSSLRLDTLSFFGNPLALLLVHDGRLLMWNIDAGEAFAGEATAETLAAVLPIALGPEAVVDVLRGAPPLLSSEGARLTLDHADRLYEVHLEEGDLRQIVWVRPGDHALVETAWYRGSRLVGRVRYDRYEAGEHGLFPMEAVYEGPGKVQVRIAWREVRLGADLPADLFEVTLPPGVRVYPLGSATPSLPVLPDRPDAEGDEGAGEAAPEPPAGAAPEPPAGDAPETPAPADRSETNAGIPAVSPEEAGADPAAGAPADPAAAAPGCAEPPGALTGEPPADAP